VFTERFHFTHKFWGTHPCVCSSLQGKAWKLLHPLLQFQNLLNTPHRIYDKSAQSLLEVYNPTLQIKFTPIRNQNEWSKKIKLVSKQKLDFLPLSVVRKPSGGMYVFSSSFPMSFSQIPISSAWERIFSGGLRYNVLLRVRGSSIALTVYVATSSSSRKTAAIITEMSQLMTSQKCGDSKMKIIFIETLVLTFESAIPKEVHLVPWRDKTSHLREAASKVSSKKVCRDVSERDVGFLYCFPHSHFIFKCYPSWFQCISHPCWV